MFYYKVSTVNNEIIDVATSADLRYASKKGKMLCCLEDKAQYIRIKDSIYRIGWLNKERPELKDKYPLALMMPISKEEYEKYMKQKENENLV